MTRNITAAAVMVLAIGGSTACATKKFVRTNVGELNEKVDSLGRSVEQTQERTRRNEGKIAEVDQRAQAAGEAAQVARGAADEANSAASVAASIANTASAKVDVLDRASRRLVFEVVLSEDQGNFRFANTQLPEKAKARLDDLINSIKADPKVAYFEIEGHTDSVGPKPVNERVGLERAEAVKRYLYEHHQIPLHKINVITYGENKPVAPNKTRDGRAQNRRVVIKVLA
jgi:outer membrane protein OmpA-like peptidoglycan-associated protein